VRRILTPLHKLLLGCLLAGVVLALGLALLEGGLRLCGYGVSPHFARAATQADGTPVWRDNRDCTVPFFGRQLARRPLPFSLPRTKAPGSYRIFVLGSSAAMGDPEPSFSLARCLEAMLSQAYPEIHFEVVNAGVTAINSHVMRGIADDCAGLSPDLFIVYEGNNEVIGPFGPSGVFSPFLRGDTAIRIVAWLRGLRLGQLIANTAGRVRGGEALPSEWGGMGMFLRQQIPDSDPRLGLVASHFRSNLFAVCRSASDAGAHTLLCTVSVNQRDFAPFLSLHAPGLSAEQLARFDSCRKQAATALARGDPAGARASLAEALSIDPAHAETTFQLGRLCLQDGRDGEAREFLARAADLDALRFRTDSRLNAIIRDCASSGVPGVHLVDLATLLAARSAHGVAGDEFFYEHVHLTLRGTYEAACQLFPAIEDELNAKGLARTRPAAMAYDELRTRLAFTMHEQGMIYASLLTRFRAAPFTGQADNAYRIQLTERRLASAGDRLRQQEATPALLASCEAALKQAPNDWILLRNTGSMLLSRHEPAAALPYLEKAQHLIPDDIDTLVALARTYETLGNATDAAKFYDLARRLEPKYPGLPNP
jgi:tetratricopeptide (TPR) repeat protein